MNVQSAVCRPTDGEAVPPGVPYVVQGYAIAGGGRAIDRVDVSIDGGRSWHYAELLPPTNAPAPYGARWAWTFWQLRLPHGLPAPTEVICRACTSAASRGRRPTMRARPDARVPPPTAMAMRRTGDRQTTSPPTASPSRWPPCGICAVS